MRPCRSRVAATTAVDLGGVGHVEADRLDDVLEAGADVGSVAVRVPHGGDDEVTPSGDLAGRRGTEAAGRAGDEHHLLIHGDERIAGFAGGASGATASRGATIAGDVAANEALRRSKR